MHLEGSCPKLLQFMMIQAIMADIIPNIAVDAPTDKESLNKLLKRIPPIPEIR